MDVFEAEELKEMCSVENCFSRDQICDGNFACPATKFDEMGCNQADENINDEDTSNPEPNPEPSPNAKTGSKPGQKVPGSKDPGRKGPGLKDPGPKGPGSKDPGSKDPGPYEDKN